PPRPSWPRSTHPCRGPTSTTRPCRPLLSVAVDPSTVTVTGPSSACSTARSTAPAGGGQAILVVAGGSNLSTSPAAVALLRPRLHPVSRLTVPSGAISSVGDPTTSGRAGEVVWAGRSVT